LERETFSMELVVVLGMVEEEGLDTSMGERVLVVMSMEMPIFHVSWAVEPRALTIHMGMCLEAG